MPQSQPAATTAEAGLPPLGVSIVLYRTDPAVLQECLQSLAAAGTDLLLFLVDNSPDDRLRAHVPAGARYSHNAANPGFGAGHNVALKASMAEGLSYHLVLNADVRFTGDVLGPLLAYMEANPDVGQVMPKVLYPDGSIQRLCKLVPTPADLLFRRLLPPRAREARNRRFELHDSGYDREMFVPYLSGCFMLLRLSALEAVGLFDERFFLYPEDIDLTRRVAARYRTMFVPAVSVVHAHGAASHKSLRMFLVHAANIARYFNKWGWLRDPERDRLNAKTLAQFAPPLTPP